MRHETGYGSHVDEELIDRIQGEYREMPGLQLTVAQAQRLFGLDAVQCRAVLEALVHRMFLVRKGDGRFIRSVDGIGVGRSTHPQPVREALAEAG